MGGSAAPGGASPPIRIALDALGSDHAPAPEVEGAGRALRRRGGPGLRVVLVGDHATLEEELDAQGGVRDGLEIRHAPDVVETHEAPSHALRRKKASSLRVAFDLLAAGDVDAVVSAGHSGAVLAMGMFVLRRLPGVERPALITVLPVPEGPVVLLDVGANVGCRGSTLAQLAVMGAVYAETALGLPRPRVGLLSNGEEHEKGDEAVRAAHALLRESDLDYRGVIEGRDLWTRKVDVAVCDGFVGNLLIKSAEGMAELLVAEVRRELAADLRGRLGALLLRRAFGRLRERFSYQEYGGALLLGCTAPVIVAHGRSDGAAIAAALDAAARVVEGRLVDRLSQRLAAALPGLAGRG